MRLDSIGSTVPELGGRRGKRPIQQSVVGTCLLAVLLLAVGCSDDATRDDPAGAASKLCWTAAEQLISEELGQPVETRIEQVVVSGEGDNRSVALDLATGDASRSFSCATTRDRSTSEFVVASIEEVTS